MASSSSFSRLGLGTVQFGQAYGINNTTGQVSFKEVCEILNLAHAYGITFLDTSRNYGNSEEVIGRAVREVEKDFTICTKLDLPSNFRDLDDRSLIEEIDASVNGSLDALGLDAVPLYLLHNFDYYTWKDHLIWQVVQERRDQGLIQKLGISIGNGPHEAIEALDDKDVTALQIPYNILDQRWKQAGFFEKKNNVTVITRSAYLQGLLLMDPKKAAEKVKDAVPFLKRFHELAESWDMSIKELAFSYVLGSSEVDVTIVGVDALSQLRENIELMQTPPLPDEARRVIEQEFSEVPVEVVNPSFWTRHFTQPAAVKK